MSPAQVGGNNDSDGCAGGRRSLRPSTPGRPRPPSCGTEITEEPYLSQCKFSATLRKVVIIKQINASGDTSVATLQQQPAKSQ